MQRQKCKLFGFARIMMAKEIIYERIYTSIVEQFTLEKFKV